MTLVHRSRDLEGRRNRHRLWRVALAAAPLALLVSMMTAPAASASSVSAVMARATPTTPGAPASYPISYTPATDQTYLGTISVEAAPGTTFTACSSSCPNYTMVQGGNGETISSVAVSAAGGSSTTNEFVITLGFTTVYGGQSATIIAQGTNPTTAGTDSLSVWTSADSSPVSVNYTIGNPAGGLIQGAFPNAGATPELDLSSPAYLQSLFGTPTNTIPTLGTQYLPSDTWADMDGSAGSLAYLQQEGWSTSSSPATPTPGYQLVLGVPILPSSSSEGTVSLQDGASSDPTVNYDSYFSTLTDTLVHLGLSNAWLRLGWEFDNAGTSNGTTTITYPWGTGDNTTQEGYFKQYWINIVTTMRNEETKDGVPSNSTFKFVWNPDGFAFLGCNAPGCNSNGTDPTDPAFGSLDEYYDIAAAWPGAQYVDDIGLDLYDWAGWSTESASWSNYIAKELTDAEAFDSQNGDVPLAFPEWGVCDVNSTSPSTDYCQGDDQSYINNMYRFMTTSSDNVAWESYFNANESGWNSAITSSNFPNSLQAFKSDFG